MIKICEVLKQFTVSDERTSYIVFSLNLQRSGWSDK